MRNLLALLGALILLLAGIGWYRGWFSVEKTPSGIDIHVDTEKTSADLRQGEKKLHNALENVSKEDTGKHAETIRASTTNKKALPQ
jgi:hypothetical protein